jgi:hypothetical protein
MQISDSLLYRTLFSLLLILALSGCNNPLSSMSTEPILIIYDGRSEMTLNGVIPILPNVDEVMNFNGKGLSLRYVAPIAYYPDKNDIIAFYDQVLFTQGWRRCSQNCYEVQFHRTEIIDRVIYEIGAVPQRQFLDVVITQGYPLDAGYSVIVRRDNCDDKSCIRQNDQESQPFQ